MALVLPIRNNGSAKISTWRKLVPKRSGINLNDGENLGYAREKGVPIVGCDVTKQILSSTNINGLALHYCWCLVSLPCVEQSR